MSKSNLTLSLYLLLLLPYNIIIFVNCIYYLVYIVIMFMLINLLLFQLSIVTIVTGRGVM